MIQSAVFRNCGWWVAFSDHGATSWCHLVAAPPYSLSLSLLKDGQQQSRGLRRIGNGSGPETPPYEFSRWRWRLLQQSSDIDLGSWHRLFPGRRKEWAWWPTSRHVEITQNMKAPQFGSTNLYTCRAIYIISVTRVTKDHIHFPLYHCNLYHKGMRGIIILCSNSTCIC